MKTVKRKAEVGERIYDSGTGRTEIVKAVFDTHVRASGRLNSFDAVTLIPHDGYEVIIEDEIPAAELIDRDPILREVHQKIIQQTEKGLKKYGKPVHPDNHSLIEWIDHAVEESIDHITYLLMLKQKIEEAAE